MPTLNINITTVVVQTAAQWAADATVYTNRQLLVTSDVFWSGTTTARKFKIANGVNAWSAIEYPPIQTQTTPTWAATLAENNTSGVNDVLIGDTKVIKRADGTFIIDFGDGGYWQIDGYGAGLYSNAAYTEFYGTELRLNFTDVLLQNETASKIAVLDANKALKSGTISEAQIATISYVDGLVAGLLDDRGSWDVGINLDYPTTGGSGAGGAIKKGDIWFVANGPGTIGGIAVVNGDSFRALIDTPGQVAANWNILETNLTYVPENIANKDTDGTLAADSDTKYASQKATKTYVDAKVIDSIADSDTTHAPSRNAVFDALALKLATTFPLLLAGTIFGALSNTAPADGSTLYFGRLQAAQPNATATNKQTKIREGVVRECNMSVMVAGTLGSAGDITFYLRNVTDSTSTLLGTCPATAVSNTTVFTGLSITTDITKEYAIEMVNPTWVTNPLNVQYSCQLFIYNQ